MDEGLKRIADHYGLKKQLRQLAEECSELAVASSHCARREAILGDLIEEIADVEVMIEQIKYLGGIQGMRIEGIKRDKIGRQLERIEKEVG